MAGILAPNAFAYTFSLSDEVSWMAPDRRKMTIGMLYGEGILSSTPARPVVLDEQGRVVALGPLAYDGIVRCLQVDRCRVLLGFSHGPRTVEPDPATFDPFLGRPGPCNGFFVTGGDQPEFGFRAVESTWGDEWFRWTAAYRRAPVLSIFITALFAALGRMVVKPLPLWKRPAGHRLVRDAKWCTRRIIMSSTAGFILSGSAAVLTLLLLVFHLSVWGGSELTMLPLILGWVVGVLSVYVRPT